MPKGGGADQEGQPLDPHCVQQPKIRSVIQIPKVFFHFPVIVIFSASNKICIVSFNITKI